MSAPGKDTHSKSMSSVLTDRRVLCAPGINCFDLLKLDRTEPNILPSIIKFVEFLQILSISQSNKSPESDSASSLLKTMMSYDCIEMASILTALIYLQRLKFAGVALDSDALCPLFLTATMVACKFIEDDSPSNSFWAKVGQLSIQDMNELEREFLKVINFRLTVTSEEIEEMRRDLLNFGDSQESAGASSLAIRFRGEAQTSPPSPLPCAPAIRAAARRPDPLPSIDPSFLNSSSPLRAMLSSHASLSSQTMPVTRPLGSLLAVSRIRRASCYSQSTPSLPLGI